jgi:hypothetical protein
MKKLNQQETSILLNNYCVEDEPTTADDELNQKVYCHKLDSHHFEIMDIEEL